MDHSVNTHRLLKQAARTLLKKGDKETLELFGIDHTVSFHISDFKVFKPVISIGDNQQFSFRLTNTDDTDINFRIEYFIGYMKANGQHSKKIFKLSERRIVPSENILINKTHQFADLTTRKHYPGEHFISIVINGRECNQMVFDLSH